MSGRIRPKTNFEEECIALKITVADVQRDTNKIKLYDVSWAWSDQDPFAGLASSSSAPFDNSNLAYLLALKGKGAQIEFHVSNANLNPNLAIGDPKNPEEEVRISDQNWAKFHIRAALDGSRSRVSFESVRIPGSYLVSVNSVLHIHPVLDTEHPRKRHASFAVKAPLNEATLSGISLADSALSDRFVRHFFGVVKFDQVPSDNSRYVFYEDATWLLRVVDDTRNISDAINVSVHDPSL